MGSKACLVEEINLTGGKLHKIVLKPAIISTLGEHNSRIISQKG
jgi:hypothetical protein